jgi:hypothetical protein
MKRRLKGAFFAWNLERLHDAAKAADEEKRALHVEY